jgi:hypothetical protein
MTGTGASLDCISMLDIILVKIQGVPKITSKSKFI